MFTAGYHFRMILIIGSRTESHSNSKTSLLLGLSKARIMFLMEMIKEESTVMGRSGMSGRRMRVTNMAGMSLPPPPSVNADGRPMSFAITNSKNVIVKNWSVIQPQFWASIVINSTDVLYKDYYVNATQYNPEGTGAFLSWLQNTDGCDTYRSHNVTFGMSLSPKYPTLPRVLPSLDQSV
jgi:polygalacturonase